MIDFWATWCGPCLMELPEVQKLVEAYAKAKKEVLIVALSQDDAPKELPELRKLVEKTLDDKKIILTGNSVGLVGLDPSHSVGDAFAVNAYPTVVLLDGKGVVQAAHVGIPNGDIEGVAGVLGKAIDTLLEGDQVRGVLAWTKQGRAEIRAKLTIDASGDADVAELGGFETFMGQDGKVQNPTMLFRLMGVDVERFRAQGYAVTKVW